MERMWVGLIVDFFVIRYHNDSCVSDDNYNDDCDSHNDYDHHYFDLQQLLLCE